jgi:hypothetical protein
VNTGNKTSTPRALRIEFRLGIDILVPSGFEVVFGSAVSVEVVQQAVAALISADGLPQISATEDRLRVLAGDDEVNKICDALRQLFQPQVPLTAYLADRPGLQTGIYLFGRRTKRELEALTKQLEGQLDGGEVRAIQGKRRSHLFHEQTDRILVRGARRPRYGHRQEWREMLMQIGIAAT